MDGTGSAGSGVFVHCGQTSQLGTARWVKWVAYAAALTPVPSGLWRIALGCGLLTGLDEAWLREMDVPGSGTVYVIVLSLVTEALALLTLGLVHRWGEVVPRWIPVVGGRTLPVHAVAVPAALGALVLTVLVGTLALQWDSTGGLGAQAPSAAAATLMTACYAPLVAWGPLLGIVTVHYYLRRRRKGTTL